MALLDMDKFTFSGKVIQAVSELIFEDTIKGPDINLIHTVFTGVVGKEEVGFIGKGGKVGVKGQGCNPTPQPWQINTRKLVWDPQRWEVLISACFTDLETTAALYSLHTGVRIPDFTDTDYMNIVSEVLSESMLDFWYRLFWFNDLAAENVEDGGVITDGENLDYFTIIDGFWKQITEQVAINPSQRAVTITENQGTTYDDQRMDKTNVIKYLTDLVLKANKVLRKQTDGFILVTQSVYDAYWDALSDACCLESARMSLINDMEALKFKGIPVIPILIWDDIIETDEDTGTKLNNPNRMLYTTKKVLGCAVDTEDAFSEFSVWYNKDERTVKMEAMGRADAKLTNPAYFSVGI